MSVLMMSAVLLVLLVVQDTEAESGAAARDENEIRKVIADYVAFWNQHDMDAWGKLFTDDVDYVHRGGGWWKSNQENIRGHKLIHEMLKRQKQKMTYQSSVDKITFIEPHIALVHASWKWPGFVTPAGSEAKNFNGFITMVMVKRNGQWLIRALQNTVSSPPARQ